MTSLYAASETGRVEVVNILLQNGARVDVQIEVSLTYDVFVLPNIHTWTGQVDPSDDSIS